MSDQRRRTIIVLVSISLLTIWASIRPNTHLYYNATNSLPPGFYRHRPSEPFEVGDTIGLDVPEKFAALLYTRDYIRPGAILMKQLLATEGDAYCIEDDTFSVRGETIGPIYKRDSLNRLLPRLAPGCFTVPAKHVLVGSTYNDRSFDSRYFGPVPAKTIHGKMEPVWTW